MAEMKKRISGRSDDAKKPSESQEQCASPEDLPCIRCGYNLRELSPDGRCPECGTPIHRSIHGDLLSAADPAWLTRVSRGFTLIKAASVTLASIALFLVLALTFRAPWIPEIVLRVVETGLRLGVSVSVILVLLGIFALTTPDPRVSLTEQPVALRRIVRGPALAGFLIGLLLYGLKLLVTAGGGVDPLVRSVAGWTFGCALAFTWVAGSFYLARLGERIPDMELAKRTKSRARRFAACLVIAMLASAVLRLSGPVPAPLRSAPTGFGAILIAKLLVSIFSLASVIYALLLMSVWSEYRKAIKRCLLEARKMGAS